MSVLIFAEGNSGEIKKSSHDAIGFGAELAKKLNTSAVAIVIGKYSAESIQELGKFGASKVLHVDHDKLNEPLPMPYASVLADAAEKGGFDTVILPKSSLSDAMSSRLAIKMNAAIVTNVMEVPDTSAGFRIKKAIYSGKAFSHIDITAPKRVLTVVKNAFLNEPSGSNAQVETFVPQINEGDFKVKVKEVQKATGEILLTDADIVVSGGRGLKGPENWHLVLDLAKELGAATGCSKPVSDLDWRPHHEHVGQTGIKVSPNIYIALGISGAIQHLAGVNSSKVIVVINKDPEAPFFKAADYGIAGDIFEIVPKLIKAAKELK